MSFLVLGTLKTDWGNTPHFDRAWKRLAWVLSCLLLVPWLIFFLKMPLFLAKEVIGFIKGKR